MKLLIISNMYPDKKHPSYGIFVKRICDQLSLINIKYSQCFMLKCDSGLWKVFQYTKFYIISFIKLLFTNYDIVYIHYASHSSLSALLAHKIRKKPIYTNLHGSDVVPETKTQEKMQKYTMKLLKISDKIIVPSEYFKDYVQKKYILDAKKIYIYPSAGVDPKTFQVINAERKNELLEKYGLDSTCPTFGMAGRISYKKGWDIFVKAISIMVSNKAKANYVIVGDGPESEKLDKLIDMYGLNDQIYRVKLLPQNELAEFYGILDYFIFPTEREGESLGLVAIEAMACGIPVIASAFAAPDIYVIEGQNGFKFKVGDYNDLAKKMLYASKIMETITYDLLKQGAGKTAINYYEENVLNQLKNIFIKGKDHQ